PFSFFAVRYCAHGSPALPSFPTRRSSDLARDAERHCGSARRRPPPAVEAEGRARGRSRVAAEQTAEVSRARPQRARRRRARCGRDRKSTRLNSSHRTISYAVFCLKKNKKQ